MQMPAATKCVYIKTSCLLSTSVQGHSCPPHACVVPAIPLWLQHASLSLLREMLAVLELAERVGNMADRRAADKLQRR